MAFACPSPDELFRNVPDLTSTTKIIGTRAFAHGGYSDIWRGAEWGGQVTRDVAIKIIRVATRQKISIDRIKKRISREIIGWCSLRHKNILPFYGLCWLPGEGRDGLPSMVYPYCEAGTCTDYLKDHPDADRIDIMCQVADAIEYLHTSDPPIVHGDIKACNILMQKDGTPLLADFGLSRVVMDVSTGLTTSSNRGSCRWMAPELFGGVETEILVLVSKESDVWAFGCLCLEVLSDAIPWASIKSDANIIFAVVSKRHPTLPPGIESTPVGHIIRHCWAHGSEDRPTMSQLVLALRYNDLEALHNPSCILQPISAVGVLSTSPPSLHHEDSDSFTRTFSESPMVTANLRSASQTKTPTALMPLEPLFPPAPASSRQLATPSPGVAGMTHSPSASGATPYLDSLGLTPTDSSSSGLASRDEPSLFDLPLQPPLFAPGPRRPSKTIREIRQSSTPMWPRTPSSGSSTLPHPPRAGDDVFRSDVWQKSDPGTPSSASAITRASSQASLHISTPPRTDSRHGLFHHPTVSMSPLSQYSSDRSTVSTSHPTPITPATPLPLRYHGHSYSSDCVPSSPSQGNYFVSPPHAHSHNSWSHSRTIPRDFQLATSKPIRISTPDGKPVTLPERKPASPLKDRSYPR